LRLERSGALQVRSPAGVELPAVPACRAAGDGLVEAHSKSGLHIGPDTLAYGGERFDLGLTIDALLCVAGKIDC
ncbi:MAG TPA: hypothetical protein VEH29_17145, partial [Acidimicrobiales bacterium]|nr:hypothetical protein [Acidimicrobiales bacterium]